MCSIRGLIDRILRTRRKPFLYILTEMLAALVLVPSVEILVWSTCVVLQVIRIPSVQLFLKFL